MANPTEGLKKKTAELGLEFSASALRSKGFSRFISELTTAFEDDQDAIFELGLDMRAFRALAILGGKGAGEFSKQLENMADAAGAAETAFEKMNRMAEAQAQIIKNRLNVQWQTFGNNVLPVVSKAFEGLLFAVNPMEAMFNAYDRGLENASKGTKNLTAASFGLETGLEAIKGMFDEPGDGKSIADGLNDVTESIIAQNLAIKRQNMLQGDGVQMLEARTNAESQATDIATLKAANQVDVNKLITTELALVKEISFEEAQRAFLISQGRGEIEDSADSTIFLAQAGQRFTRTLVDAVVQARSLDSALKSALRSFLGFAFDFGFSRVFPSAPSIPSVPTGQSATKSLSPGVSSQSINNTFGGITINNTGGRLDASEVVKAINDAVDSGLRVKSTG